jgi:hypothetical protein
MFAAGGSGAKVIRKIQRHQKVLNACIAVKLSPMEML